MNNYSDFDCCIKSVEYAGGNCFTGIESVTTTGGVTEERKFIICYSPYITYNYKEDKSIIHCYVYHWKDTYDKNGKFISHHPYEGVYTNKLVNK